MLNMFIAVSLWGDLAYFRFNISRDQRLLTLYSNIKPHEWKIVLNKPPPHSGLGVVSDSMLKT